MGAEQWLPVCTDCILDIVEDEWYPNAQALREDFCPEPVAEDNLPVDYLEILSRGPAIHGRNEIIFFPFAKSSCTRFQLLQALHHLPGALDRHRLRLALRRAPGLAGRMLGPFHRCRQAILRPQRR